MYAILLADHSVRDVDVFRVVKMLLIHDIVEIDAGDMPIHGTQRQDQAQLERAAAERIFGLLPSPQADELRALWEEFEAAETFDAQFAKALDRLQPLLVNVWAGGGTWTENAVSYEQVLQRYGPTIKRGAPDLWTLACGLVTQHFGRSTGTK